MDKKYKDRGYSDTFEKITEGKKIPYLSQFDVESYIEGLPGALIHGGIIKSNDGKLEINLETGSITYNDGVTTTVII